MELPWKRRIRRELRRRNRTQLGNYESLVESYTRLLELQDEGSKRQEGGEMVEEGTSSPSIQETPLCVSCQDSQRLRDEIVALQNRLCHIEREHQHLFTRCMEEKEREAERINHSNEREERYQRLKEKLRLLRAQAASVTCDPQPNEATLLYTPTSERPTAQ
ncbi:hypothetical protein FKM82_014840 [Ascaphus truei]